MTIDQELNAEKRKIIHINGYVGALTAETLFAQVKLTHSNYSSDSFVENRWAQQFRQDLNVAKAIIFIGYSMSDIDVSRILFSNPEIKRRTVFIVSPHDDDIVISPLEDYGSVDRSGIEKFASLVAKTELAAEVGGYEYTWLKVYKEPEKIDAPTDKDAVELLTMGRADQAHVVHSLSNPSNSYCLLRSESELLLREIEAGRKWFLVHSDLGNGKSLLKQQLTHLLHLRDFKIFWDSEFQVRKIPDLRKLVKEDGQIALMIDESPDRFEIIDNLLSINTGNIIVFIFVRSTLYELGEGKYERYLPSDYLPLDANRLENADIEKLVRLLDRNGLWGQRANDPFDKKAGFIKVECRSEIAKLIVSVFEESEIGRRITNSARNIIDNDSNVSALIILAFLFNRIGHTPKPSSMSEILGVDVWRIAKSEKFSQAGEFIRLKDGVISARSSIIATFLLRKCVSSNVLVKHLENFVRRLSKLKRDAILHHIFIELQRFPVVEGLIESKRKREYIIGYYQEIKDIPFCERSALFWLHYAMARLSFGEFAQSALYFKHAQSLAQGNMKDLIEINNHYAKLLLESRTKSGDYNDYSDAFAVAHDILIKQMNKGTNKHFPYRQAKKYVDFISFRHKDMTVNQINVFIQCCRQVISAIDNLDGAISRASEVNECKESMRRAIEIASRRAA